jgi:drug/metabolite transporter (DMT)-like permease
VTPQRQRRAYAAWLAVCLIWGTTYLGIKVCLETMPPMLMGGLRFTTAGLLLATGVVASGQALPGRASWPGLALLGFLFFGMGNGGVIWAEVTVPSGLVAVLVALTPFWMVALEAFFFGGDRIGPRQILGLMVAFAGIVILVWPDLWGGGARAAGMLAGLAALQLASLGWAFGSSYSRRHARHENAFGAAAIEMLFGGLFLAAAGTVLGEWPRLHFTARTGAMLAYLIVVGSIAAFASYVYALKYLPVSTVSLYAYINPVIAVALGALLLGEPFDARIVLAIGVILSGVAIVQTAPRPGRTGQASTREAA